MTGFGCAEKDGCRVEVRSLNHRFLDIYIKAPVFLNQHDLSFRNTVKERFSRGKIDVSIIISEDSHAEFVIHADFVRKFVSAFRQVKEELSLSGEIDINTITHFREIFLSTAYSYDINTINEVLLQALDSLFTMRVQEGGQIASELRSNVDALSTMNEKVRDIGSRTVYFRRGCPYG
jgi:uncharacterized protein (TIGR00255 family)